MMSRCTGHCCRRFNLPMPLAEIQRRRNPAVTPPGEKHIEDGDKLAEMLIPIDETGPVNYWFTCKHHDPAFRPTAIVEGDSDFAVPGPNKPP